jgi:hypothetical protein
VGALSLPFEEVFNEEELVRLSKDTAFGFLPIVDPGFFRAETGRAG